MDIVNKIINEEIQKSLLIFEAPRFKRELENIPQTNDFSLRQNDWYKKLDAYKEDPFVFVTFSTIPKLGINPKNDFDTPTGIYGYPLYGGIDSGKISVFATDRPYALVFRPTNPDKILNFATYTEEDYNKDIIKLKNYFTGFPNDSIYHNAKSNAYQQDKPSSWIWNTLKDLSDTIKMDREHKTSSQFQWNQIMYNILGYEGAYDSAGESIIHENEPFQAVFFRTNTVELIELINKTEKEDITTKGQTETSNSTFLKLKPAILYGFGNSDVAVNSLQDLTLNFKSLKNKKISLKDITLSNIRFKEGEMTELRFENVLFENCRFDNLEIDRCFFKDCNFSNTMFFSTSISRKSLFYSCQFNSVIFDDNNIFLSYPDNISFTNCRFVNFTALKPLPTKGNKKAKYINCNFEYDAKIYLDVLKDYMSLDSNTIQNLIKSLNFKNLNVSAENTYKSQTELRQEAKAYLEKISQ